MSWFDRAFGPEYETFYAHRDREDAERDVDRVLASDIEPERRILDLCCGGGRHLELLRDRGCVRLVGLDRSGHLLERARQLMGEECRLVRGDIRALPFADAAFHAVLNLFTSFGYFDDDSEHARSLREVRRVLSPGGRFHMDHIDRAALQATLVPRSEERRGDMTLHSERQLRGDRIEKRLWSDDGSIDHSERVRLWSPDGIRELLAECGFGETRVELAGGRMHVWATA